MGPGNGACWGRNLGGSVPAVWALCRTGPPTTHGQVHPSTRLAPHRSAISRSQPSAWMNEQWAPLAGPRRPLPGARGPREIIDTSARAAHAPDDARGQYGDDSPVWIIGQTGHTEGLWEVGRVGKGEGGEEPTSRVLAIRSPAPLTCTPLAPATQPPPVRPPPPPTRGQVAYRRELADQYISLGVGGGAG
jgi:hypothetical protein